MLVTSNLSLIFCSHSSLFCSLLATLLVTLPPPARRSSSWPHSLPQVSTGSNLSLIFCSHSSLLLTPGYSPSHPASSCKEILQLAPQSPSGLYWIRGTDNEPKHMYCDMERSCEGVAGGWMRLASIDMTDNSSNCPSGLRTITSPRRMCARNNGVFEHSSVFPVHGVQYS